MDASAEQPAPGLIRFSRYATLNPGALAVVEHRGRRCSRGELSAKVNALSRALLNRGLSQGEAVALVAPNCIEFLATYLACTQIGLYVVPVNWHLHPKEVAHILGDCKAAGVVVHSRHGSLISDALSRLPFKMKCCIGIGGPISGFEPLDEATEGLETQDLAEPVQGRVLAYTSATTGSPKGVLLPLADADASLNAAIRARLQLGTLPEAHVQLCCSALYHGAPLEAMVLGLHMGHAVVLLEIADPETVLSAIHEHRVTMAYIVPITFTRLLNLPADTRAKYDLSSLKRVVHTGAACPVEIKKRMIEWWGPIFVEAYGAAEGGGTLIGSSDWLRFPGSVGRPISGTRLRIVSEDGVDVPEGQIGTIYMTRSLGDRFEYLGDPEKTRRCHLGEFFTVGDLGYVNSEGFLFLCDRKIDMINLAGVKVYPAEIEKVLAGHPLVADCAVFGVPDRGHGERIVAVVQLQASATADGSCRYQLLKYLGEHLSAIKIPRQLEFVAELPRDSTGKMKKRLIRERFVNGDVSGIPNAPASPA